MYRRHLFHSGHLFETTAGFSAPRALKSAVLYLFQHEVMRRRVASPLFRAVVYRPLLLYLEPFLGQTLKNLAS